LDIAALAGHHEAMHELIDSFEEGAVSRESIDVHFGRPFWQHAYNNSCAKVRSQARDLKYE
jgi:hypothetical protein